MTNLDDGRLLFFASPGDLRDALLQAERQVEIEYLLLSHISTDGRFPVWPSSSMIDDIGLTNADSPIRSPHYLVGPRGTRWRPRKVRQAGGGTRYFVDQSTNPDTVRIISGGVHPDNAILLGTIDTTGATAIANRLFSVVTEAMRSWRGVGECFVGPEAERLGAAGYRLILSFMSSPTQNDLKL